MPYSLIIIVCSVKAIFSHCIHMYVIGYSLSRCILHFSNYSSRNNFFSPTQNDFPYDEYFGFQESPELERLLLFDMLM